MAKPEIATPTVRELLPLKSTALVVNRRDFANKSCIVHMDDNYTLQDIQDNPALFRVIQKSRDKALNALDEVMLVWHERVATTIVDFADAETVQFLKMDVKQRNPRDRIPWQNSLYEVRPFNGQWAYYRKQDNVRMSTATWPTWEAARSACEREQAPARV